MIRFTLWLSFGANHILNPANLMILFCILFQLILETEGIDFKIEGYLGGHLAPLLSCNSKMQVNLRNWSTNVSFRFLSVAHCRG